MKFTILSLSYIALLSNHAYAYIDPGLGAMLIQGLIATIAAVVAYISLYWRQFKNFINKLSNSRKNKEKKD